MAEISSPSAIAFFIGIGEGTGLLINIYSRINKKHFVIFNNGGVISATTPKDWARAHQKLFPYKDINLYRIILEKNSRKVLKNLLSIKKGFLPK